MDKIILFTSIILFLLGILGVYKHNNIVRMLISIKIITISAIMNLIFSDFTDGDLMILVIITASELTLAVLFILLNHSN